MLLPKSNPYVPGEFSIFDMLVKTGEAKAHITLPFQFHLFLVNCLVEHLRDRAIVHHVLALRLLESTMRFDEQGNVLLRRTGDAALLLAGLLPERALHLNVSSVYFRSMGQTAYASLATRFQATGRPVRSVFYNELARHFQSLEKVLNAVRARPETEWGAYNRFRLALR